MANVAFIYIVLGIHFRHYNKRFGPAVPSADFHYKCFCDCNKLHYAHGCLPCLGKNNDRRHLFIKEKLTIEV